MTERLDSNDGEDIDHILEVVTGEAETPERARRDILSYAKQLGHVVGNPFMEGEDGGPEAA